MPFKVNQDRRHHIPRQRHRVTNFISNPRPPRSTAQTIRANFAASATTTVFT